MKLEATKQNNFLPIKLRVNTPESIQDLEKELWACMGEIKMVKDKLKVDKSDLELIEKKNKLEDDYADLSYRYCVSFIPYNKFNQQKYATRN